MYEIEIVEGASLLRLGAIPNRCQATEAGVQAYIESAFWTKSIPADTKIPPMSQIMDTKFYNKALAWFDNKGWMKK